MYFGTPGKDFHQLYHEEKIQNKSNSALSFGGCFNLQSCSLYFDMIVACLLQFPVTVFSFQ